MSIIIRPAQKEDCPRILNLVNELAEYEKATGEVTVSLDHFTDSGFGPHPVWWAFVAEGSLPGAFHRGAENEVQVIGCALYYIRFSTWKGQRMYLEDIIVTRDMRGKGIGKMLFEQLIKEAKEKKLNGIVWQVLAWNTPAIHFYEKYHATFDNGWVNVALNP